MLIENISYILFLTLHCPNARRKGAKILTASSLENWRPPGCPRTTWMKTIQQDLKSNNLFSLNEATDVAQNRPLWRLMSTFKFVC